ncbi:MAG: hypothetical protein WBB23_08465 [Desulforhopalus sp.]
MKSDAAGLHYIVHLKTDSEGRVYIGHSTKNFQQYFHFACHCDVSGFYIEPIGKIYQDYEDFKRTSVELKPSSPVFIDPPIVDGLSFKNLKLLAYREPIVE